MAENPTASGIAKSVLIAIVSRGLAIVSAWAVAHGILAPEILTPENLLILAAGIAGALIALGWIIFNKIRTWYLVQAAKDAKPSDSMATIKAEAKSNSPV